MPSEINEITTPRNKSLIYHLHKILTPFYPERLDRLKFLTDLLHKFESKRHLELFLTDRYTLILLKDERKLNRLRRFGQSAFPLLQNIEYFSNSVGEWNQDLLRFGIKTRTKENDPNRTSLSGTRIHLILRHTLTSRGNAKLHHYYRLLKLYRHRNWIVSYWSLSWHLMSSSWEYKIACLNSWKPRWYKEFSPLDLKKIFSGLNRILSLSERTHPIQNVWIESPKGKWRQLGVPTKAWRFYLHMLNQFLSYIYEPHLPSSIYDGFIFNRGCKSWWETVLWGPLLTEFSSIFELDFSSGFPNLSWYYVRKSLESDGLLPPNLINLLMTHLTSPLRIAPIFPTFETFVEHECNTRWRSSARSVHMGLGISPLLFVITLNWTLKELKLLTPHLTYKWYADDGSFYFNLPQGLYPFYRLTSITSLFKSFLHRRNPFVDLLNNHPLLKRVGLRICTKKSGFVKLSHLWLSPYKSLGLTLYTTDSLWLQIQKKFFQDTISLSLKGSTRGRGSNPHTGKKGTLPSNQELYYDSGSDRLTLSTLLSTYRPYFGLLQSKLYSPLSDLSTFSSSKALTPKIKSTLWTLNVKKQNKLETDLFSRWNLYNYGYRCNHLLLENLMNQTLSLKWTPPNFKRNIKLKWIVPQINPCRTFIPNPILEPTQVESELEKEYFKKFSELKLTPDVIRYLEKKYNTSQQEDKKE